MSARMKKKRRLGLISDTHGLLRNEVYGAFKGVDEILHAGDVGDRSIITELEVIAPVQAVYGNVDGRDIRSEFPEALELERAGHTLAMIHGHQWGSPHVEDLVDRYPGRSIIIFGHTHLGMIEKVAGSLVINPGSAGQRRFGLPVSVAILTLKQGEEPVAKLLKL